MPFAPKRYCLVSDDNGHRYACPVGHREEFYRLLEALGEYWGSPDERREPPPRGLATIPGLLRVDGNFTFTDPKTD